MLSAVLLQDKGKTIHFNCVSTVQRYIKSVEFNTISEINKYTGLKDINQELAHCSLKYQNYQRSRLVQHWTIQRVLDSSPFIFVS